MIKLCEITKDNLDEVLTLDVFEHQKAVVSSTAASLAQAYVYRETAFPFAIYADNTLVGFIMLLFVDVKAMNGVSILLMHDALANLNSMERTNG